MDPQELRIELHQIRTQGYALDNLELADDMRCVAVPIFESEARVIRGFSISGPVTRFTFEKLDELKMPMDDFFQVCFVSFQKRYNLLSLIGS